MNIIKNNSKNIEVEKSINKFRDGIKQATQKIVEACELYVKIIDKYPECQDQFKKEIPEIPPSAWYSFEAVGRKWIDYRLLWGGGRAGKYLKKLPLSEQRNALDNGIKMLVKIDNNWDEIKVKPEKMTIDQVKQAFDRKIIRDIPAQRAYIESNNVDCYNNTQVLPYKIINHKLIIVKPVELSKKEMKQILKSM